MKHLFTLNFVLIAGFIVSMLSSCASTVSTTYQLSPVSGDIATIEGRSVTKAEQNGVGVVASFEREDLEFVALDVEIKNHTDHSIEVNPADFHFTALGPAQDTLSDPHNASVALTRSAANPTYEAGRIGLKRKQEQNRLKKAKIFNTILMIAAVASDVSSSGRSRSYGEYVGNRVAHTMAYQGIGIKRAIDYSTFADRMQRYDYEEYRWRELALKPNTVAPGESVRGFVYLPKVSGAHYLAINYTLPEQASVPLLFKQELMQKRTRSRK